MKLSEVPLRATALCKQAQDNLGEIFEITPLALSKAGIALYYKVTFEMSNLQRTTRHCWHELEVLDKKWVVVDFID